MTDTNKTKEIEKDEGYFLKKENPYFKKKREYDFSKQEDVKEFLDLIAESNKYIFEKREALKRKNALVASETTSKKSENNEKDFEYQK